MRKIILVTMLFLVCMSFSFAQAQPTGTLRDFVGQINIQYHPDVVSLMNIFRENFDRRGWDDAVSVVDIYLRGMRGSGFIYVAPDGRNYVITNEHVISHSHSISITFERLDGGRTTFERLRILRIDEENDMAILYFEDDRRPFQEGLVFSSGAAIEGSEVFAAGFPHVGFTPIWQFSAGRISNAFVRLPRSLDSDETIGPYLQHTAQIDPGNSGGPLLSAREGVPSGYEVIGMNTLSARWRQAANFAIPASDVVAFIEEALSDSAVDERQLLAGRVEEFIQGLGVNRAVYNHIAGFLSSECTATNAEFAMLELVERASRTVVNEIDRIFGNDFVMGMNASVGWLIENQMRTGITGPIRARMESIERNLTGGFTVILNINDNLIETTWVNEYGVFRMNTYGDMVTGDRERQTNVQEERQRERQQREALNFNYNFIAHGGLSYLPEYGFGFTASIALSEPTYYSLNYTYVFGDKRYSNFMVGVGLTLPINANTFGIIPFGEAGLGVTFTDPKEKSRFNDDDDWFMAAYLKGGLMLNFASNPNLIWRLFVSRTFVGDLNVPSHWAFGLSIGYGF